MGKEGREVFYRVKWAPRSCGTWGGCVPTLSPSFLSDLMEAQQLFSVLSLLGRVSRRCISAHILALCSGADGYQGQMPEGGHDLGISCHPDMGEEWPPAWAMWTQGRLPHHREGAPGAPDRWGRGPPTPAHHLLTPSFC